MCKAQYRNWIDCLLLFFKAGITEEQMLQFMGANTHLSPLQAKMLLEVLLPPFCYFYRTLYLVSLFVASSLGCNSLTFFRVIAGWGGWLWLCQSTGYSPLTVCGFRQLYLAKFFLAFYFLKCRLCLHVCLHSKCSLLMSINRILTPHCM